MKRFTLILSLVAFLALTVGAQKSKVNSADASLAANRLDIAKDAIDVAMQDEEMQKWDKAWYVKGKVYHAIHENPLFTKLDPNSLIVALDAYKKQLEVAKLPNAKGKVKKNKYKEDVLKRIGVLKNQFINKGVEFYNAKNYADAMKNFEKYIEITEMEQIGTDSLTKDIIFNTAVSAELAEDYTNATKYYTMAKDAGYNGETPEQNIYLRIVYSQRQANDSLAAFKTLQEGFTAYPDNKYMTLELINYYLKKDMANEALEFIQKAKDQDPTNESLVFAEGTLYEKNKDLDAAAKSYEEAIKLKPNYFDAYYNLGALYYNIAASKIEQANAIPPGKTRSEKAKNQKAYDEKIAESKDYFKKAMPYMEKAHELDDTDIVVMQTLQTIYVRQQMYDESKIIKEKIANLQK